MVLPCQLTIAYNAHINDISKIQNFHLSPTSALFKFPILVNRSEFQSFACLSLSQSNKVLRFYLCLSFPSSMLTTLWLNNSNSLIWFNCLLSTHLWYILHPGTRLFIPFQEAVIMHLFYKHFLFSLWKSLVCRIEPSA